MSGIDRRAALRLLAAVGVAGAASACGATGSASPLSELWDSHVRIGLLIPRTGGHQQVGDEIVNGFRRYLRTTDNRLGGHPVIELMEDEGDSSETARTGLNRLLGEDVHAVIGMASSTALLAVSPLVAEAHVPLLSASASPQDLQSVPYIWRTFCGNHQPGIAVGTHLLEEVSGPVAVIAQDDPLGTDAAAGLREVFAAAERSDQLIAPIFTPTRTDPGTRFFRKYLKPLAEEKPAAVFCAYDNVVAPEFIRQYLDAGLKARRLYGPGHLTEGAVLAEVGTDAIGIRTVAHYAPELRGPSNRSFAVAYRAEFGPPTSYAVASYDAASVLDTAIRLVNADDPSPRDINLMLGGIGLIDSPRGRWQFNQNRTPTQKWYLREVAYDGPVLANMVITELGTLG